MSLTSHTRLGPYEIVSPLGAGGMGEVYRARDTRLDRDVAIKVLPERTARDEHALSRFRRETKALAALSHPNILMILDVGEHQGVSYAVMELLEGDTLRERLRILGMDWRKALEIGAGIADGLAAAHARGVVHRDLKPENLFLTKDGVVKILDFGLARTGLADSGVPAAVTMTVATQPGVILGTVNYMSPEQVRGQNADARCDIFSLGCVLHEMLTGKPPFVRETSAETMTAILRHHPTLPSVSGSHVPPDVDPIVAKCLEKSPEERFHSAHDLAFTLRSILAGSGASTARKRPRIAWPARAAIVALVLVALIVSAFLIRRELRLVRREARETIDSLAVLPLENVSRDPEQEYFVDGMTEALISDLAKIGGLKVISRTSVMRYKATTKSLPEIAKELNVDAVVEGSVLRVGERVRITAQLIHAATEANLWAESYDRDLRDVLRLHSELARTIAQEIRVTITPQEQARMTAVRPVNPEAHQAYLKGRFHWNKRTPEGLTKAIEYFEQAVAVDPAWPLGYAGLAAAYVVIPQYGSMRPLEASSKARATAAKALELDESLGEAHATLALIAGDYEWNWPTAEREFERALALSPNYATAHHWYALYLLHTGRHGEAIREIMKAQELDPLSMVIGIVVGRVHLSAGQLTQAETQFHKMLELGPDSPLAHMNLAILLFAQGRHSEAIAEGQEAVRLSKNEPLYAAHLAFFCGKGGQPEEARRILGELTARSKQAYVTPSYFALVHAGLEERDRMFEWLEAAYQDHDAWLLDTLVGAELASLRSDPRLADLLRRVGLPPLAPMPSTTPPSGSRPGRPLPPLPRGETGGSAAGKIMLAVLPFENLSRDPEQDYFSDGLTEEMISQLSRLNPRKLGVIARTSAMHYKNTAKTIDAIGRELGVAYIVEGSVRRAGERVRITAQLIAVSDQSHLWAENYERDLKDIFALQSDVAERIAGSLTVELLPGTVTTSARARPVSPAAHEAYLKGRFYWNKRTSDGLKKAVDYFEQAVALDPDWPLGYAGLADAYALLPWYTAVRSGEAMSRARAAAAKALQMDESLAEAHASLGWIAATYDWDWSTAEREYQRALALSPNYATAHHWYAVYLRYLGNHREAIQEVTKAHETDPLSLIISNGVGLEHYYAGNLEQAETWFRKTLELGPDFTRAHRELARTLCLQQRFTEAITEARAGVRLSNNEPLYTAVLGYICAKAGQIEEARRILDELAAQSIEAYVAPTHFALVHAGLDESDRMFESLERACQERDILLLLTLTDPLLAPMRGDPRFVDLLRRVGLPPLAPIPSTTPPSGSRLGRPQPPLPRGETGGSTAGKIMLAVLPFENLSGDPDQEFFSDGMTEELISQLGRINPEKLEVIARTSAMQYKKNTKNVDQIGRELKVDYVVEGSVRRADDRVRITAQLVQVDRQTRLWGEAFDRELKDVLALQSDVALAVARQINVKLNPQVEARLAAVRPVNPAAHEAYMRGRFLWHTRTQAGMQNAIEHFRRATQLDPLYAPAYAGMADSYTQLARNGHLRPKEAFPLAKQSALKAVEIDDALAEAHGALAFIALYFDWDWTVAERELRRALDLNESYEEAHHQFSHLLLTVGKQDESLTESKRALALNPLDLLLNVHLGWHYMLTRQYDQAIAQLKSVLEMDPNHYQALRHIGWTYMYNTLHAEAITALETAAKPAPDNAQAMAALAAAYAAAGRSSDAQSLVQQLEGWLPQRYVSACDIAAVYAALNEADAALDWLEKALEERSPRMVELGLDPVFDPLRSDPRFTDLARRVGLPMINR